MRRILFTLLTLGLISTNALSQSNTSLHYWDFNAGNTGTANAQWSSPISATSTIGSGVLTHDITLTEIFAGSALDASGYTSTAGNSFSAISSANNGKSIILTVPTSGYQNISFSYATRGTSTGFTTHTIDYSTDGSTYTNFTTISGRNNTTFSLQTVDFTSITAANDNANFKIRITLSGSTNTSGNNRFDNFRVVGNLATSNNVSLSAVTNASESGTSGVISVNLSTPAPAGGVTVTYTKSGTATAGSDYSDALNGTVFIPEGSASANITLVPVDDTEAEGTETISCVITSVTAGFAYSTTPAIINLTDNDGSILYAYDFSTCTAGLSDGFTGYSTSGAEVWACTTFGQSGNGIQMNGFAGTAQNNEDWVISPALNLSSTTVPVLTFYSRTKFAGPSLKLYVSTNYSGTGDPAAATWTEINGKFPSTHSDAWTLSSGINLSAFKQTGVYIAFVYTSTTAGASRWTIDNINVIDAAIAPAPGVSAGTKLIDLRQINFGSSSTAKTVGFWADNLTTDLTITAPAGMELSKDGSSFTNPLVYTAGETVNAQKTLHVRFTPQSANANYAGYLQFSSTSLSATPVFVKGHSYPSDQTLNIVNWNIEWFGSAASGPADEVLQQANAKTTMEYINADAYALAEIVDATRFGNLVSSLAGGYSYVLGEFCSSGATPAACASAQKLAFVYKTSVFSNVTARPLMNNGTGSTAYTNWASGRYPYLVNATVNKNGVTKNINFIVLHAKAQGTGTEVTDYNRRKGGVDEMKDTLNTYFSNANVMILGDFNDDLDSTIVPEGLGINPRISSYTTLISDSTDTDSYRSVTLPLSLLSKNSTFSYADFIDHAVISNEMANAYINYSATIYDDISSLAGIANFSTTTSDHYPVMNSFLLSALIPSKLVSFNVAKKDNSALISWSTAQEINSKHFVVERSTDGRSFISIGTVTAAGNSQFQRNYQFIDATPAQGLNYYRIKTIDIDNRADLSKVATIHFGKSFYFGFGPNPAKEMLLITIENVSGAGVVQLSDLQGRSLMQSRVEGTASQTIRMNVSGLSKGVYLLQLKAGTEVKTAKVVIE